MKSGIYKITNTVNGKVYVGSAVDLKCRQDTHLRDLKKETHHSIKLQRAWNKYGPEAFIFEVLLVCSKENLLHYEQRCIDGFDAVKNGYNVYPTAGSALGAKRTEEFKNKVVQSRLGKFHSEETRAKLSAVHKGRKWPARTLEHRKNLSAANMGKKKPPHSEEHKAKISASIKLTLQRKRELKAQQLEPRNLDCSSGTAHH